MGEHLLRPRRDGLMNSLYRLITKVLQYLLGNMKPWRPYKDNSETLSVSGRNGRLNYNQNFNEDYITAINLVKPDLEEKFPDNYVTRSGSQASRGYDHGEDRAAALDTMSAAVAAALRDGATVRQAAKAGTASIGI